MAKVKVTSEDRRYAERFVEGIRPQGAVVSPPAYPPGIPPSEPPEVTDEDREYAERFIRGIKPTPSLRTPVRPEPVKWILEPDELPLEEGLSAKKMEYRGRGLTASQYNQIIDEWIENLRRDKPEDLQEYLDTGKRFAGFGWIDDPMQFVRLEVADVIGFQEIGLTSEKAHKLSDKLFPGLRQKWAGASQQPEQPTEEERVRGLMERFDYAKQAKTVLATILKGIDIALIPVRELGMMTRQAFGPLATPEYRREHPEQFTTEAIKERRQKRPDVFTPEAIAERRPGGKVHEEYQELPIWEQLFYEQTAWAAVSLLPGGTALRAKLATTAAKPGVPGVAAETARLALAPLAGVEKGIAVGLKYGIGLPLKYGVAKPVEAGLRKSFEKALDIGLDKWIVRQGIRADQAPKIIQFFVQGNKAWLYKTAQANLVKRMAEKRGVQYATTKAAQDTVKEAESLLLKASEGVTTPTVTPKPPRVPEAPIKPPTAVTKPVVKPEAVGEVETISGTYYRFDKRETIGDKQVRFYSNDRLYAEQYQIVMQERGWKGEIIEESLELNNPLIVNATPREFADANFEKPYIEKAIKEGYDAVVFRSGEDEFIAKIISPKPPVVEVPVKPVVKAPVVSKPVARRTEIEKLLLEPSKDLPKDVSKIALRKELREISAKLVPQEKKLRQQIMAQAKTKGLPESQYRKLFMSKGGSRWLTNITLEKLPAVLDAVKSARPVSLRGKKVIKPDTEKLIQTQKADLIEQGILTEETYRGILKDLKLPTDKYSSKELFITQSDGRTIIREMNNKAILFPLGDLKFGKPTIVKLLTSQTYYAEKLGVKPLVEPLELAKVDFDEAYRAMSNAVDVKINAVNKAWKVGIVERKLDKPTIGVRKLRDLLDKFEEAPAELTKQQKELFNWFRNLNRTIIDGENQVRRALDMPEIAYREAYVRHIPDAMAEEILLGTHPLPPSLEYWSKKLVSKKVFNPMEFHRQLSDDLAKLYTKDLAQATKNMVRTGLKEIHFAQPLRLFTKQLGALSDVMPASTKEWVVDYVNQTLKGQPTRWDAELNRLVADSGFGGLMNDLLRPYRLSLGTQPVTKVAQEVGRFTILAVLGLPRPRLLRLLIRNLFQRTQELALHNPLAIMKGFVPEAGTLKKLMGKSSYLKGYTGVEEWPADLMSKIEKVALAPYQTSAVINARQAMRVTYHDTIAFFTKEKYKDLGWASPKRTYTEAKDFLYPEEEALMLGEMELASRATQYQYIGLGMPEIFRNKTLIPVTRLQSWWMNHIFMFHRESAGRLLYGRTAKGQKLPWSRRINYLTYLLLGGAVLTSMGYSASYLWRVLPHNLSPVSQFMMGLLTYVSAGSDWEREKGKREIFGSWKAMVPGPLAYDEFQKLWSGEVPLWSLFFYGQEDEGIPPRNPTWNIINRQPALDMKTSKKDIAEAQTQLGQTITRELDPHRYDLIDNKWVLVEEEDYVYNTVDLGSAIRRATSKIEDKDITEENGFSDLTLFYKEADNIWTQYYYSMPGSLRPAFRESRDGAWVEAYLYFWGRLTVLRNPNSPDIVRQLIEKYDMPEGAVKSIEQKETRGALPSFVTPEDMERARQALGRK